MQNHQKPGNEEMELVPSNETKPRRDRRGSRYLSKVTCQACDTITSFSYIKPSHFTPSVANVCCEGCKSKALVHILKEQGGFKFMTELIWVSDLFKDLWLKKEALKKASQPSDATEIAL